MSQDVDIAHLIRRSRHTQPATRWARAAMPILDASIVCGWVAPDVEPHAARPTC